MINLPIAYGGSAFHVGIQHSYRDCLQEIVKTVEGMNPSFERDRALESLERANTTVAHAICGPDVVLRMP